MIDPAIYNATAPQNVEGLSFTDMAEYANQAAEELKNQGCQIVVGMAHCIDPKGLASSVNGVNLWIAGHEHDTINEMVTSPDGSFVLVVETGYHLWNFGNVEISCTLDGAGTLTKIVMQEYLVDYETGAALSPNPQAQSAIENIEEQQESVLSQTVGYTPEELDGVWEHLRIGETTVGRAVTDAYLLTTGADIAFENAGGIRASIPKGGVTYQNVLDVSPYGNYIVTKELTGKEILEILETSLEIMKENRAANEKDDYNGWPANSGSMLQVGGMEIRYNMSLDKGNRIISALVKGEAIQEDKAYLAAMNNYLPNDTENYPQLSQKANVHEYGACEDALAEYLCQSEDVILEGLSQEHLMETTEKHRQENLVIHGAEGTFVYGEQGGTLSVSGGSTQKTVDFASSNEQTAVVDSEGNLSIIGAGETVITAVMAGDEQYEDISAETVIQVEQAGTEVTLTYTKGEKSVLTTTAKKAGNGTYPTGTFLFAIDKNTEIEAEADASGQTSVDISNLTKGKHTASVIYQGDHNYKETSQPTVIEFEILKSVQETKDIEKPKATVKTSDETNAEFYILLALVSITGIAVGIKRKQGRRQG